MLKKRSVCLAAGVFAASWVLSAAQDNAPESPVPTVPGVTEVCIL